MWWNGYWPMHWMFFGPGFIILLVVVCMAMMFFMMRGGRMMRRYRGPDALDILRERFARGEISQAEYEERRRVLEA
jgi:putative membrane protein